jgi:hypothetical protein
MTVPAPREELSSPYGNRSRRPGIEARFVLAGGRVPRQMGQWPDDEGDPASTSHRSEQLISEHDGASLRYNPAVAMNLPGIPGPHDFTAGPDGLCSVCGDPPRAHGRRYPETLYGGTPPHVRGSVTSLLAAERIAPIAGTMQARVLAVVRQAGEDGATCDEVEQSLGGRHQSISARIRELVLLGWVEDSGRERPTRSRRHAVVYVALPAA